TWSGPGRDLPCGPGGNDPCIHRCCGSVPVALCFPAEANSAGDEGRCGCRNRDVRKKRAGEKSILDHVRFDGWTGPGPGTGPGDGPGTGPGDGPAGGGGDYGDGGV